MSYMIRYDISSETVDSAEEVDEFLNDAETRFNNWGTRTMSYWIGPEDMKRRDMPLRIDVDPDAGAAAIRWVPDGLIGVAEGFHPRPIATLESSSRPLVEVPAAIVRADPDTAKQAAAEYVATGRRPTCVDWIPGE